MVICRPLYHNNLYFKYVCPKCNHHLDLPRLKNKVVDHFRIIQGYTCCMMKKDSFGVMLIYCHVCSIKNSVEKWIQELDNIDFLTEGLNFDRKR